MTTILPAGDPKSTINRANVAETCGRCHGDKSVMQGSGITNQPFLSYRESVHAQAVARGNTSAAVCTDCHNSHDIRAASDAQSTIFKVNIPSTCGKCHVGIEKVYDQSVHGQLLAKGDKRGPVCTDIVRLSPRPMKFAVWNESCPNTPSNSDTPAPNVS